MGQRTNQKETEHNWMTIKILHIRICGNAANGVLTGKCIVVWNAYIRKDESSQISDLNFYFKKHEKEGQNKLKLSQRTAIKMIRVEISIF